MSREFRIAVNITLPSDEMEETEAKLQAFKVKGAIQKLVGEYKLTAAVEHETVTPRTSSTPKIVPGAPSTSEARATAAEARQTQPLHPRSAA